MQVRAHDFPKNGAQKAVPYGIYDIGADTGCVSVGCDGDTSAFVVATLRRMAISPATDRRPERRPLTVTCGVWPRRPQVRPLGGRRVKPASSSKQM